MFPDAFAQRAPDSVGSSVKATRVDDQRADRRDRRLLVYRSEENVSYLNVLVVVVVVVVVVGLWVR